MKRVGSGWTGALRKPCGPSEFDATRRTRQRERVGIGHPLGWVVGFEVEDALDTTVEAVDERLGPLPRVSRPWDADGDAADQPPRSQSFRSLCGVVGIANVCRTS